MQSSELVSAEFLLRAYKINQINQVKIDFAGLPDPVKAVKYTVKQYKF